MLHACSRCGRVHAYGACTRSAPTSGGRERKLRNTSAWHRKSLEVRKKADNLCQVCRGNGRYIYEGLEVHHIEKVRDRPDLLLDDYNLVCLCVTCHKKADNGELDADHLRELARKREENC